MLLEKRLKNASLIGSVWVTTVTAMVMSLRTLTGFFLLGLVLLGGCVQTKTTPGYARAGDHVVIGLGGIERNAGGEPVLKPGDLTITLTDASATPYTLEPRLIFKSYPDYASRLNGYSFDGTNVFVGLSGMIPYDGGWFVLAPLTLPGQYDQPLPLAVGPASIAVTSAKLTNTADNGEGDLAAVPIEIIAGTSPQDVDFVRQFISYTANPNQFVITPDNLNNITEVGGAYFVIDYNDDTFFKNGLEPQVLPSEHNPYVQLNYNVISNGNGTGSIRITLLNPAGFRTLATATANASLLSDLSVRIVYYSDGTPAQAKANFSLNGAQSYYIRTNGTLLGSMTPVMAHYEDL